MEAIEITEDWHKQLMQFPYVSQQKGRMSHLLKAKSKIGIVRKERKKYDVFFIQKRQRPASN